MTFWFTAELLCQSVYEVNALVIPSGAAPDCATSMRKMNVTVT